MKKRILFFDDEPAILNVFKKLLEMKGYEVIIFSDPSNCPLFHESECTCKENEYCTDIIISDLRMEIINGVKFAKEQITKGCKVDPRNIAIVSGFWDADLKKIAEELGCATFSKPLIITILDKWLEDCNQRINKDRKLIDL